MKKHYFNTFCCLLFACICMGQIQHEDLVHYKNKYPEQSRVSIKQVTTVIIDFNKKDSLDISTTRTSEYIYIDKHANRFSKRSVQDSYFQRIEEIEAMSQIPVSETKYKTYKVKEYQDKAVINQRIFFDDVSQRSFEYPNLREGAKTHLSYTTKSTFPQLISAYYFGDFTNAEFQQYVLKHHKDIQLDFRLFNGCDTLSTYSKSEEKDYITHTWTVLDQEPLKDEYGSPSFSSTTPHIYPIIQSYKINEKTIKLLDGVNGLHDWYTSLLKRTDMSVSPALKTAIDSIHNNYNTPIETVEGIFNWVQHNIKYVAYEDGLGGFIPRPPSLVFDRKFGDCKDMALLQKTMLAAAGIEAHIAWIGTRRMNYTYEQLPSPGCDNHMIATYKAPNNQWHFLDATGSYTPFGHPSEFIQGKEAMIHLDDTHFEIVEVEKVPGKQNLIQDSLTISINGSDIKGSGAATFQGYPLTNLKYSLLDADSTKRFEKLRSLLQKGNNRFFLTLDNLELNKNDKKGVIDYQFESKDYLTSYGDELYLNLNLENKYAKSKFESDREMAYELDHFSHFDYFFHLNLGDEFSVVALPESNKYVADNWGYEITYTYHEEDNSIDYHLVITIKTLLIEPHQFDAWNLFIKQLNKSYHRVITLSKN